MSAFYALRIALAALLCTCALQAEAAITCTLAATSVALNYVNGQGTNANASGTITLNCTRLSTDANSTTYWVSIDYGSRTGLTRRVFRHSGGTTNTNRLDVNIYKNGTTTDWTHTNTGTGRVNGTLAFGAALSASTTLTYNFRVTAGQTGNTAGIFDETFITSLQLTTAGAVVATASFTPTVSIIAQCFVGQVASGNVAPGAISPSTLTLAYTSFATTNQTANMTFTVHCTRNTTYTLAIAPASGTLLGLNYTLAMSPPGTPAITGTGLAQSYTVTGTINSGQAGTCSTAACSATQNTTLTVTY
jgi:spore coat protein U-like protein